MPGIDFMNGNDVRVVIIKSGQPFLFLFLRPLAFGRRDIVIGFGRSSFEGAWRIHRGERNGTTVLWRFFHTRPHFRRDCPEMMTRDVFSDLFEIFPDVGKQTFWRGMLTLDSFED